MTSEPVTNKRFAIDMGWYLLGTLVPMGVGFFKTPVFTRYFSPEEYGYLGLVGITFTYISIFLYSWLAACLWRYYNAYKNKNNLSGLYSNILYIYAVASIIMLSIAVVWYFLADQIVVKNLVLLSFITYFVKEFIGLYLIVVRLEGQALQYNIIHSLRAVLSFALLYVLTFIYHYRIESVLVSSIIIDGLVTIVVLLFFRKGELPSYSGLSRKIRVELYRYGSIGLVSSFFFLVIASSDRYIIALYYDMTDVGIYNQVYNISQLSVFALVTVYFNTINPRLNRELENDLEGSDGLIRDYIFAFLLFGMPLVTWLSMYPRQIAFVLLGDAFRSGYQVMPWVFVSAFIYGLFLFIELKFRFANKLKNLAIGVILASVLNVGMNFILVPRFGYIWAAITTFFAYVFLLGYFYGQDMLGFFKQKQAVLILSLAIGLLATQYVTDVIIRKYFYLNFGLTILEILLFAGLYFLAFRKAILKIKIPY